MLDAHGQPVIRAFNAKRNRFKAMDALLGILQGITADGELNEREVLALDIWLREHAEVLDRNDGDVVDIVDLTADILRDQVVTSDELEEMRSLISTVLEFRYQPPEEQKAALNTLLGIVHGLSADRLLRDVEIEFLRKWLRENEETTKRWPASELRNRLSAMVSKRQVDQNDRDDLLATLDAIVGGDAIAGPSPKMAIRLGLVAPTSVKFEGQEFCLTGKFVYGPRAKCETAIRIRGGKITANVTQSLDYLVVGTLASEDWAYTSHGRKVEKAIEYRDCGCHVQIVPEEIWSQFLALTGTQ